MRMSCSVLCNRFCAYDAHGLYQRIDCLAREYMVKRKSFLTHLYKLPASDGIGNVGGAAGDVCQSSSNVVAALLEEYDALKRSLEIISPALLPLVSEILFPVYLGSSPHTHTYTHTLKPLYGPLSGITRVGRYQKRHSPTHT